ncbi:MAG: PEGA domain-containing protein [Myxococcales bacterium]|nr:PEGA domain-containing protein [Myxococcales bacterium]
MRGRSSLPGWQRALAAALAALLVAPLSSTARAAGGDAPTPKTTVTAFLLPARGFSAKLVAKVTTRLRKELKGNKRLEVKDWNKRLAEFSGEVPSNALSDARKLFRDGLKALGEQKPRDAIDPLKRSIELMEKHVAFLKKRELAASQLALGIALGRSRKRRAARDMFIRLLTWRPRMRYNTNLGADLLSLFAKAKRRARRLKRGSIELKSDPPGAKAYVDGRFMGVTPTAAFGLTEGDHYATFKKPGYVKAGKIITVSGSRQLSTDIELKRSEKFLLLKQTMLQVKKELGRAKASDAMVDLKSFLFVDQVVFAVMGYAGPGKLSFQAYLYDLRSRLRLSQTSIVIDENDLGKLGELSRMLYLNVRYDGTIEAPPPPPPPKEKKRRAFYATWWFWTAVAAGAAAITLTAVFFPRDESCQGNTAASNRCVGISN